jgi:hypothetical protein
MAENTQTKIEDKEVTITLKTSEIFQCHLSLVNRLGFIQQRWANAATETEQNVCEDQIAYLTNLSNKLQNVLKEIE